MTRDTVWQDDPPFAVGETNQRGAVVDGNYDPFAKSVCSDTEIVPVSDDLIERLERQLEGVSDSAIECISVLHIRSFIARIKAERERFQELRNNYKCGEEYEAGLWSRRNIEAFFRDQEGK